MCYEQDGQTDEQPNGRVSSVLASLKTKMREYATLRRDSPVELYPVTHIRRV